MIKWCLTWGITLMGLSATAQPGKIVSFHLNTEKSTEKGFTIEALRYYVSNIQLIHSDGIVSMEANSYHLVDLKDSSTWYFNCPTQSDLPISEVHFILGTDSLINTAGILTGDLDPIKGMYWSWNTGYINLKLKGYRTAGNVPFEYHIGGYLPPYASTQKVELHLPEPSQNTIEIHFDPSALLIQDVHEEEVSVLTPGDRSVEVAKKLADCFSIHE